jgi:hypothetical protein
MKSLLKFSWLMLFAAFFIVSCDEDEPVKPILVEDGYYVKGNLTPYADYSISGAFVAGLNEADANSARTGMYEKYVAIKAGSAGFNIYQVAGQTVTIWGPATVENIDTEGANEQPDLIIQKGTLGTSGVFTVPADGLYHIIIDKQTNTFIIAPVPFWAIIGGSTPLGWSDNQMPLVGGFNIDQMKYEITGIELRTGDFKLRYGNGWKLEIATGVKANSNFGGVVSGTLPNLTTTLVSGSANYSFVAANEGVYTVTLTWTATDGYTSKLTKTGEVEPLPEYPEAMYIVGAGTAYGWDNPGTKPNAIMHKCAGGVPSEGIFWKICHLAGGEGFKLAAANWGEPNLGFAGVSAFDVQGVAVTSVDGNMSVAESGMYIIVLNLRDNLKKVSIKTADVYGIGDAFGGYTTEAPANKFTINNVDKTLVSPALTAAGNIRMYAYHTWIPAWWNAEFNVFTTTIEYRNDGGDQNAVAGTVGQVVTLHFDDNTGSIN